MRRLFVVALLSSLLLLNGTCSSVPNSHSAPDSGSELGVLLDNFSGYVPETPDTENDHPLEPVSGKTAFDYFRSEKILAGWNLGNSLDSHGGGKGNERAWGNPYINQELLNGVKAAGFGIVRIPITWMGHIGPAPDHHVLEARIKRVGEVVDMAHNAGLKVIINLHHDGSTPAMGKEEGWISIISAAYLESEYERITWQFVRLWTQIAVYFKDYGDWLMFESLNEIHDGGWGSGSASGLKPQLDVLNKWNQLFSDAVRSTGGNNAGRYLVFPGYCTKAQHTLADYFILPKDSVSGRQVVTFHYYDPYEFTIAGRMSSWGTDSNKKRVEDDFAPFKAKFIDNAVPVIIGEIGAARQLYPDDKAKEDTARKSRLDYLSWTFAAAKKYGLVPIYWDNGATSGNGEKFGLFDRSNGQANSDESKACITAMIKAVN